MFRKVFSCCFLLIANLASAQYLQSIGISEAPQPNSTQAQGTHKVGETHGLAVECTSNKFYGCDAGTITEYELNGTTVNTIGVVSTYSGSLFGVGISSGLINGPTSPTFYGASFTNPDSLCYFVNGQWACTSIPQGIMLVNAAGGNNKMYFHSMVNWVWRNQVISFDGSSFDTLYTLPQGSYFSAADIACDGAGNVYFITNDSLASMWGDYINVVSPGGVLIQQFSLNINTLASYGMMISGNTLYIAFSANPVYNFKLLPVTLSGSSAILGTPITLNIGASDLASCNPGLPLSVNQPILEGGLSIYPNPVDESSSLNLIVEQPGVYAIEVFDLIGNKITSLHNGYLKKGSQKFVIKNYLSPGMYICRVNSANGFHQIKFLK